MRRRWIVLALVAVVMMMGYVFWDIMSPMSTTLKASVASGGMGWTAEEYGFYAGSYSIFNIFFLMLFFAGVILDKFGIRLTGLLATGAMLLGALINFYALWRVSPLRELSPGFTLFGLIPSQVKAQVLVAALGFGMFGVGCDITGITVSKVITKWFTGHELASAMGIQVALARLGTASALSFSPLIALHWGVSAPLIAGAALLLLGFVLFIVYCSMDRRRGHGDGDVGVSPAIKGDGDDAFRFRDFLTVLKNPGFWAIALLCVFFYSSIRPFMKFATDLMVTQYGVSETTGGWIVAAIPYGTIVFTPLFGAIYDRVGHGALLMLTGCGVLTACHLCLLLPAVREAWYALVVMVFLGVAYSLTPSTLWPSVPKIVPLKQLGTAYSIIYFIQNIGLMVTPIYVGNLIDRAASPAAPTSAPVYTSSLIVFAVLGALATLMSLLLLRLDKRHPLGLEQSNIQ